MSEAPRYAVFSGLLPAVGWTNSPLPAATALYERLTGPVAENPYRLGKPLDNPQQQLQPRLQPERIEVSNKFMKKMLLAGGAGGTRTHDRRIMSPLL